MFAEVVVQSVPSIAGARTQPTRTLTWPLTQNFGGDDSRFIVTFRRLFLEKTTDHGVARFVSSSICVVEGYILIASAA